MVLQADKRHDGLVAGVLTDLIDDLEREDFLIRGVRNSVLDTHIDDTNAGCADVVVLNNITGLAPTGSRWATGDFDMPKSCSSFPWNSLLLVPAGSRHCNSIDVASGMQS